MEYTDFYDMVQLDQENSTQCAVYDQTPGSEQKKINIIVRPAYTVGKVIADITTQYHYDSFDLVLQPTVKGVDLVYLNDRQTVRIYEVPGFHPLMKNTLILLPAGEWDDNVKKRYDLSMSPLLKSPTKKSSKTNTTSSKTNGTSSKTNGSSSKTNGTSSKTNVTSTKTNATTSKSNATSSNSSKLTKSTKAKKKNCNDDNANANNSINNTIHNVANDKMIITDDSCNVGDSGGDAVGSGLLTPLPEPEQIANVTSTSATHSLNLSPISDPDLLSELLSDDDLALGASASPTETEPMNGSGVLALAHTSPSSSSIKFGPMTEEELYLQVSPKMSTDHSEPMYSTLESNQYALPLSSSSTTITTTSSANGYVGLVNQAMTCYLNSLLQALYMTPEFRNALYTWEFDNDNEAKSIPYQLQKLFLNLQTSKKSAVETTDLTRSFGWDSTEAWQQHDIQELCRVMFDALEHKFKNTKQMNLISSLYEGKMLDYVKCLECNTEKTRADTFLDIPLPVRPFGSTEAYGSIEEALFAFVQPETLDGNNQYFCEKCNKKCDAHKGLKFKNFPYVLTLHLKRFDFDYQTMHRIKLNDKVTFPQTLNLNAFVNGSTNNGTTTSNGFVLNGATSTTDDCSTTDSGTAMEEDNCSSGIATTASSSQHENDMNDDDEGIDIYSVEQRLKHESGPYLYELFAIMIHAGSAAGGHYYAYIKEFDNNEWFCFNDQSVSSITQDDIHRSFGGGSSKAYYSSLCTSSTNAYMLMYRQIDTKRNERAMKVPDFPPHINTLLPKVHAEEESRVTRSSGRHSNVSSDLALQEVYKPRVYFYNPELKKLKVTRVYCSRSFDVNSVLDSAYQMLNVDKFAPLKRCRLVGYDQSSEEIMQSFENVSDPSLAEIRDSCDCTLDFLLEHWDEGQKLEAYKSGGVTWYVYTVKLKTMEMDGPYLVHSSANECNAVLQHSIAVRLNLKENEMLLASLPNRSVFVAHEPTPTKEAQEHLQTVAKAQFRHLTYFYLNVPNTDVSTLEIIGVPAYETQPPAIEVSSDVVDAALMNGVAAQHLCNSTNSIGDSIMATNITTTHNGCLSANDCTRRESPLPPATGHESNSEDSSLSDGDRTLVESMQNRGGGDSQISSSSHSPQLSSPEEEATHDSLNRLHAFFNGSSSAHLSGDISTPQFFHSIRIDTVDSSSTSSHHITNTSDSTSDLARKPTHAYKIIMSNHMKSNLFLRHIESLIRVPLTYFKMQRKYDPISSSGVVYITDGETLQIELGKELQPDEHKAKIFFMRLSELDNDTGKLPCVCEWCYTATMTVAESKKELITKLHRIDAKYKTLTLENCRLWLKGGRSPIKILGDEETLSNDLRTSIASEFLVQECEDGVKPQTSEDSLTLFVRRWYSDELKFDKFQEITLEKDSEIRDELAKITDIPKEHIAYSKVNGSFPCTNMSLLSINNSVSWFSISATLDNYPLASTVSGSVYFYKDVSKGPKELTTEEHRELSAKEKTRLDRLGCLSTSFYSPRRERALKIHLDVTTPTTTASPTPVNAKTMEN